MRTIARRPGLAAGVAEQTRSPGYLPGVADRADIAVAEPPSLTQAQVDAFALVEPVESPGAKLDREMSAAPDLPDERDQRIAELEARLAAAEQLAARIARTAPAPVFDPSTYSNPAELGRFEHNGTLYVVLPHRTNKGLDLIGAFAVVQGADGRAKTARSTAGKAVTPATFGNLDELELRAVVAAELARIARGG